MHETWKPIPGWEGVYEASDAGRIRSVDRWIVQSNRWGNKMRCRRGSVILTASPNKHGYLTVCLNGNGRRNTGVGVANLVAKTFLGPRPKGLFVCHNNGDKADNRANNLRYDSPAANIADAIRHGTFVRGQIHHKYRADVDEAELLRLRAVGWTYERLAQRFGIGEGTVGRILSGVRLRPGYGA